MTCIIAPVMKVLPACNEIYITCKLLKKSMLNISLLLIRELYILYAEIEKSVIIYSECLCNMLVGLFKGNKQINQAAARKSH